MCLGIEYTCGPLGQGVYSLSGLSYSLLAPILAQSWFGTGSETTGPGLVKFDKKFDRAEAQNVDSHVSDHPSLVGEEPVLAVWFGARMVLFTFPLDAEEFEGL